VVKVFVVVGGELADVNSGGNDLNPETLHVAGVTNDVNCARSLWRAASWSNVDNALMRYFIREVEL